MIKKIIKFKNEPFTILIDKEDELMFDKYSWYLRYTRKNGKPYVTTDIWIKLTKTRKKLILHRVLLGVTDPKRQVDHINGDTLDNRKENLRDCNYSENNRNRKKGIRNTSGYKGVCWNKGMNKWFAQIRVNRKQINIGHYSNILDAVAAYNEAALKYHGEFANLSEVDLSPSK